MIKGDDVKCFQINEDNTETEIQLSKNSEGYYVHDINEVNEESKYYYKATINNVEYTSPIIRAEK